MTYSATEEEKKALKRTKIALMKDPELVFFANMMLQMEMHFSESIPTACTYDLTILLNPKYFMEQTPAKRMGLMAHEIMHPALLHRERKGHRTFGSSEPGCPQSCPRLPSGNGRRLSYHKNQIRLCA